MNNFRKFLIPAAIVVVLLVAITGGAVADRLFGIRPLDKFFPRFSGGGVTSITERKLIREESVVIDIAERVSPAVVTIAVEQPKRKVIEFDPFGGFGVKEQGGEQDLATGFIVVEDGLVVTNKHVVANSSVGYKVVMKDGKEYPVRKIYRDPSNDVALLKIDSSASSEQVLPTVELGESDNLKVGQFVVAIGTALGEFRHTVTTGVISGLGRGITAGSGNPFEGYVERLDNVIQTDAAINRGNSGGPLLDSSGKVIGINVAVAAGAQNVGFALPVNVLRSSIDQFRTTGEFVRPFLGVQYRMVSREVAIANEVPQGAYVQDVIEGSSADRAGVEAGDIIVRFGGEKIEESGGGLAALVGKHKVGDKVEVEIWRGGETLALAVVLAQGE